MAKLLLGDALSSLAPETLPAGSQTLQISWINAVCSEFFVEGKPKDTTFRWKGTTAGVSFAIYYDENFQAYVTLPRNVLSLLASAYGASTPGQPPSYNVRFSNMQINGPWHEFANGGYGVGDQVWGRGMLDAGDGWTTFQEFPNAEPSYLRVVRATTETSPCNVLFRGTDQNDNEIYSGSGPSTIQGVMLDVSAASTTQTTQVFGRAPSLVQKPVTNGPLNLYSVGVNSGTVTLIAIYDPGDKSPGFRRYKLGGLNIGPNQPVPFTTLHAMVKRRFVPAVSLSDEIIPGNLTAIELGLQGRRYDLQGDRKNAMSYWGDALSLLNSEVSEFRGAAVPRIMFQRGSNLAGNARI